MIKYDLFKEWLPSVVEGKGGHLYSNVAEQDVKNEDFMVLRALSHYQDCLPFASLANEKMNGKIAPKLLYDFLFYGIPKKKRFSGKWGHAFKEAKELEVVKKAFKCNNARAKEYMELMDKEVLKQLVKDYTNEGGRGK